MSKVAQYHCTTLIELMLKSCWCQIVNTIWISTHEVNMMSRMCLENDYWQKHLMKKYVGWKNILVEKNIFNFFLNVNVQHQFDINSWRQFDVDSWHHKKTFIIDLWLMIIWHQLLTSFWCQFNIFVPTGDPSGKMSALFQIFIL